MGEGINSWQPCRQTICQVKPLLVPVAGVRSCGEQKRGQPTIVQYQSELSRNLI